MKIYLIGMPGSGKSTVGKPLADRLNTPFLDLDQVIEAQEGAAIRDIFATKGEGHFRTLEEQYLKETTRRKADFVLSTGGGTPCFFTNMDFMLTHGKVVFLDVKILDLVDRFKKEGLETRPLLKEYTTDAALLNYLQEMYSRRLPFYERAHLRLNVFHQSPLALTEAIIDKLEIKS